MTPLSIASLPVLLQSATAQALPVATGSAAPASVTGSSGWLTALQVVVYLLVGIAAVLVIVRQIRPLCRHWQELRAKSKGAAGEAVSESPTGLAGSCSGASTRKASAATAAVRGAGGINGVTVEAPPAAAEAAAVSAKAESEALVKEEAEEERRRLVVITAAIHIMGNCQHKIVSIRPREQGWAQEGRREIALSHRFR